MKKINTFQFYFGRGLRINYNGDKYLIEKDEIPGLGDVEGTIKNTRNVQSVNISGGNVVQSNDDIYINGINLEEVLRNETLAYQPEEIEKQYADVEKMVIKQDKCDTKLVLSDEQVYVKGFGEEPKYRNNNLFAHNFNGIFKLPRGLELEVDSKKGDVEGDVAQPGSIYTRQGDIYLYLHAPLNIKASTKMGDVDVMGMMQEKKGFYTPDTEPTGTLDLRTGMGDIEIYYRK